MSETVRFVVLGEPRPKPRPRFGNHGRAYTPRAARASETIVKWEALRAMTGRALLVGPVRVTLRFYVGNARRVDVDNLAKLTLDALNGTVWRDDSQIAALTTVKTIDRECPRTEILVEPAAFEAAAA